MIGPKPLVRERLRPLTSGRIKKPDLLRPPEKCGNR
jgi:hypothetical protein